MLLLETTKSSEVVEEGDTRRNIWRQFFSLESIIPCLMLCGDVVDVMWLDRGRCLRLWTVIDGSEKVVSSGCLLGGEGNYLKMGAVWRWYLKMLRSKC